MADKTKTAKTPEKPSGKASIVGSTKPYKEPKVLGPTTKVKSVGNILGGNPKKNPTLSTKFFGTCSATNDPGNKKILGEASSFSKLSKLDYDTGAALILPNGRIYMGDSHYTLRKNLRKMHMAVNMKGGTIRIRYAGTAGFPITQIEFAKFDDATIQKIFSAMQYIKNPPNRPDFEIYYDGELPKRSAFSIVGTPEELKRKMDDYMNPQQPTFSRAMNYWRTQESKKSKKKPLTESLEEQLGKLHTLSTRTAAALFTSENNIYVGTMHWFIADKVIENGDDPELNSGTVRIRYAGTEGIKNSVIEFTQHDAGTIGRVLLVLDNMPQYSGIWDVEFTGRPYKFFTGPKESVKNQISTWYENMNAPVAPKYSHAMNYWRTQESKKTKSKPLNELTYKEFRNASKAVTKNCPACKISFKNVHDANQKFCSMDCEKKGGLSLKLKEAFEAFNDSNELASQIRLFLKTHAKSTPIYDETQYPEDKYNSPDVFELENAADQLESLGFVTKIPNSNWESGGYKPYSDIGARKLHDELKSDIVHFVKI
jgi:hypothetical protein